MTAPAQSLKLCCERSSSLFCGLLPEQLESVVQIFRTLHLTETALSTTDLVRVQLLRGKPGEAYETAKTMLRLLEPLRHNQL